MLLSNKGVNLRSIAIVDYEPTMCVGFLSSSSIKTPKDLEGKRVGQTLTSTDAPFFKPFCEKNGVDISKVNLLNMDARVRNQALVEGRVDAITGLASSMLGAIGASGKDVRFFLYSDYGLVLYGNVVMAVTPKLLDDDPDLCKNFTSGLVGRTEVHDHAAERSAADFPRLGTGTEDDLDRGGVRSPRHGRAAI